MRFSLFFLTVLAYCAAAHSSDEDMVRLAGCTTNTNKFTGLCVAPSTCDGGIYNNLCANSPKCCVDDVQNPPFLYWRYVYVSELMAMFPTLSNVRAEALAPWFNVAIGKLMDDKKGMTKCEIIAAFAAQVGHESLSLTLFEELASGSAYENRCSDLGNCYPGDGVRFKGRGAIQITGRTNYQNAANFLNVDLISKPELLVLPSYGFQASTWFWVSKGLNQYCDGTLTGFTKLTKVINGGTNGLDDRINRWNLARQVMKC